VASVVHILDHELSFGERDDLECPVSDYGMEHAIAHVPLLGNWIIGAYDGAVSFHYDGLIVGPFNTRPVAS
jgi:hypothetical protein